MSLRPKPRELRFCISLLPKMFNPQTVRSRNYRHFIAISHSFSKLFLSDTSLLHDQTFFVQIHTFYSVPLFPCVRQLINYLRYEREMNGRSLLHQSMFLMNVKRQKSALIHGAHERGNKQPKNAIEVTPSSVRGGGGKKRSGCLNTCFRLKGHVDTINLTQKEMREKRERHSLQMAPYFPRHAANMQHVNLTKELCSKLTDPRGGK